MPDSHMDLTGGLMPDNGLEFFVFREVGVGKSLQFDRTSCDGAIIALHLPVKGVFKMINSVGTLKNWIEPAIEVLDVAETQLFPGVGADGSGFPDCTRS